MSVQFSPSDYGTLEDDGKNPNMNAHSEVRETDTGAYCRTCFAHWDFEEKEFVVTTYTVVKAHTASFAASLSMDQHPDGVLKVEEREVRT